MKHLPFGDKTLTDIFGTVEKESMIKALLEVLVGIVLEDRSKNPSKTSKSEDPRNPIFLERVIYELRRDSDSRCCECITAEDVLRSWNSYDFDYRQGRRLQNNQIRYMNILAMKTFICRLRSQGFTVSGDDVSSLHEILKVDDLITT